MAMKTKLPKAWYRNTSLIAVMTVFCWMGIPLTVAADDGGEAGEQAGGDDQAQAVTILRTANDAFEEEDYARAYEHYQRAYELLDNPLLMYRMGQTAEYLGDARAAVEHYQKYQQIGDDEEFLARIDEALPSLMAESMGTVEVISDPAGATVLLVQQDQSEEFIGQTPTTLDLMAGEAAVVIRMDGYEEKVVTGEVIAGETVQWEATLAELLELQPPELHAIEDDEDGSSLALWGWTSLGLGTSMLALGGVMTYFQMSTTDEVNEFDRGASGANTTAAERDALRASQQSLRDDAETYHRTALVSYITGGAFVAAGAGILIFDSMRSSSADEPGGLSFQGGITTEGAFLGVGGQF